MMVAQLLPAVERPELIWEGLLPVLLLGGGALLLVLFRSLVRALPESVAGQVAPAMGALSVLGMVLAGGFSGTDIPLGSVVDDLGWVTYLIGLLVVMAVVAWGVARLGLGLDATLTAGLALAAFSAVWRLWNDRLEIDGPMNIVGDQLGLDGFSLVFTGLIALAVVLVALLLDGYLRREGIDGVEMYVLMLLSATGGVVMASANDLIVLFLALETLSIAVYVMAAMHLRRGESQEAGLKYFLLGAFASAFLLYGIALTYGATGSTNLIAIRGFLDSTTLVDNGLLMGGFAMLLVGFGFKVGAAPFHAWTPDVYQGAPTPVTAFMASVVKAAAFAALIRVFVVTFGAYGSDWQPAVAVLALLTLLVGSLLAIVQRDAKRMLAFSSLGHAGFMLVGVQAASDEGVAAVVFYAVAYSMMAIGSFAVLTVVSGVGDRRTGLDDLDGLAQRRPALALAFTIFLLAQAGVPLTAGFVAKFEVIGASVSAGSYWLAIAAMVTAVISAFLYLRIVLSMYLGQADEDADEIRVPGAVALVIGVALVVTVGFGLVPGELDTITREAVPRLVSLGSAVTLGS
jgi:NADH-quinone oxidoreductase subunit N